MSKYKGNYDIFIGAKKYISEVYFVDKDGETYIDGDSLIKAQTELALEMIFTDQSFDKDLFNYLMDISAKKSGWMAEEMGVSSSLISQVRKGEKDLSKAHWKLFRIICAAIFEDRLNHKSSRKIIDNLILRAS